MPATDCKHPERRTGNTGSTSKARLAGFWDNAPMSKAHEFPFESRLIDPASAEAAGLAPVTSGFAPTEFEALTRAAAHFQPAGRAFVLREGRVELWRPAGEIHKWNQDDEVNQSTAIRIAGTGTRKIRARSNL